MVRLVFIVLTFLSLGSLDDPVVAQTQNAPTKLITKIELTGCLEESDFTSMVRAVSSDDSATLNRLLVAKKCVRWPAGTRLFLNESTHKATGPYAIPGVTGNIAHVYTADDYRTYLAPFPLGAGDAETFGKMYEFVPDQLAQKQLAQKQQSEEPKQAQGESAKLPVEKIMQLPTVLAIVFAVVALIGLIAWLVRSPQAQTAIQFAKIVEGYEGSSGGVIITVLMLIIFSFVSAGIYASATTVFQEMVALLIWIGSNTFWGTFLVALTIARKRTYIVYSDIAVTIAENIARLEKLQEQASSMSAVANATSPGLQIGARDLPQAIKQEPI
jgi:accessory gene regulator protein AgrB